MQHTLLNIELTYILIIEFQSNINCKNKCICNLLNILHKIYFYMIYIFFYDKYNKKI